MNNKDHDRFSIFEEDDEERSKASVSTSVVSDAINNRNTNKVKLRHKEEKEE